MIKDAYRQKIYVDANKFIDLFAKEVSDGKREKINYRDWREISRSQALTFEITLDSTFNEFTIKESEPPFFGSTLITGLRYYDNSLGGYLAENFSVLESLAPVKQKKESKAKKAATINNWDDGQAGVTVSNSTSCSAEGDYIYNGYSNLGVSFTGSFDTTIQTEEHPSYYYDYELHDYKLPNNLLYYNPDPPLYNSTIGTVVGELVNRSNQPTENNNNKNKENKKMNTKDMFHFEFGPASDLQFRMSPYGLAIHTNNNGWVAYNAKSGEMMDVEILNFDISKMIYKMPVALGAISIGDILIHSGKPVFVRSVNNDGTVGVIDYATSSVMNILPVKSPFGFNFFTKICPLFDFNQVNANADNPFGNMLPFLMLGGEKDSNFDPAVLFMASAMGGNGMNFASNPMMLYFLMNRQDKSDILPFMLMMNGGMAGMGTSPAATPVVAPAQASV